MKKLYSFFLALAGLLFASHAGAQTYDISWHTIAGGGGTSSNGVYSLSGTIGQPATSTLSGGGYTLTGGFWGIFSVVQTPGSPLLSIVKATANQVTVGWPAPSPGFVLQVDPTLGNTNWVSVNTNTYPVTVSNGTNTVTIPATGNGFFRLISTPQ